MSPKGNALFLILIAVALFAALSYAVTQSGRGGGGVSKEQTILLAGQIVQYAGAVESTVNRMLLTGTAVASLSFCSLGAGAKCSLDGAGGDICITGSDCFFAPDGGGFATGPDIPDGAKALGSATWYFESPTATTTIITGIGTGAADANLAVYGLTLDVCNEINRGLGLGTPPAQDSVLIDAFIDAYPGEYTACYEVATGNQYGFYHVLYPQ